MRPWWLGTQAQWHHRGGVDGGSETKLEIIGFQANEAVGQFSGIVLRLFSVRSMVGEESSFRKCGGVVEENRLRGEESPD